MNSFTANEIRWLLALVDFYKKHIPESIDYYTLYSKLSNELKARSDH